MENAKRPVPNAGTGLRLVGESFARQEAFAALAQEVGSAMNGI